MSYNIAYKQLKDLFFFISSNETRDLYQTPKQNLQKIIYTTVFTIW